MTKPYPDGGDIDPVDPDWPRETEHGGNLKPLDGKGLIIEGVGG